MRCGRPSSASTPALGHSAINAQGALYKGSVCSHWQEHPVPGWVGGVALGAGLVLLVVGIKKR